MRENLFRGKRVDNGEWVIGDLYHHKSGAVVITADGTNYEVIPETVGEFTGLTDKNGVKIFEGDIVKNIETEKIGEVKWDLWELGYDGGFYCWCAGDSAIGCRRNEFIAHCYEVIGNIHDKPELLEVKEDEILL